MLFKCFLLQELSSIQRYIPVSSYRRLLYGSDDADKSRRSGTSEGYDSLQFVQHVLSWPRPNYITSGWRSSSTICITQICTDAGEFQSKSSYERWVTNPLHIFSICPISFIMSRPTSRTFVDCISSGIKSLPPEPQVDISRPAFISFPFRFFLWQLTITTTHMRISRC